MSPLLKKTSFDSSKCASLLEVTLQRIKILRNKRLIIAKQSRDDVAKLLQKGQDANAAARVEHAFREANIAEAYDLLEQYCQLIIKHRSAIKSQKECPSELKEAIASLVYAAPRCGDLQELQKLRDILSKCGAEYSAAALDGSVNQQIIQKLSGRPPNSDTRLNLLREISREYKIDWNYQKAIAASFKNGETSMQDNQKVSKSPSQVSKGTVLTDGDNEKPCTPVSMHYQEQASAAAHIAIPSKSNNANSEPRDFVRANQSSDVARHPPVADIQKRPFDSLNRDGGYKTHTSAAGQNTSPSTTHSSSPKPREFVGASKKPIVGPPTTVDREKPSNVPVHQVSLKEKESLPTPADAVPSTMNRVTSRQKDFMGANQISDANLYAGANKQKPSSMYAHQDELKGQSRNSNSLYEEKGFVSPSHGGTPKPASVVTRQDGLMEKANSAVPSTPDHKVSRPKAFANPIQVPDVSIPRSPERRKSELDRSKEQATSTQETESLAAKQYMRAHKSYIKADTDEEEEDHTSMENSGANVRPKHGTHGPHADPYVRARQEGKMDYKQVQEPKRTSHTMDGDEDSSSHEYYAREQHKGTQYYAREQPKGTHYQRGYNASSHDDAPQMSKEREWLGKNEFSSQGRHQAVENYHRNPSMLRQLQATREEREWLGRNEISSQGRHQAQENYHRNPSMLRQPQATRASVHSKLDDDLAELEAATETAFASAARAADAAKAAIDMVRTSSMRTKADRKVGDVKAFQRESYPKISVNSSRRDGHTSAEGLSGMMDSDYSLERKKDEHERKHYIHPSTHAEMSVNAEIQVALHVEKKTVLVSTKDLEHETAFYDKSIRKNQEPFNHSNIKNEQQKQENNISYTEAYQEQEPVFYDSEMPQFDDYSSYESSEEEPPSYTKGRAATVRKDEAQENKKAAPNMRNQSMSPIVEQGPVNFINESVRSSVNTRYTNGGIATSDQEQQGRSAASNAYVNNGAIRWGASVPEGPTRDVRKQRWNLKATEEVNAQPALQAHIRAQHDHPAIVTPDSQTATGKYLGISRRSVRSSRPTQG